MDNDNNIIIDSIAFAGYKSFGKEIQHFDHFSKINLFIGQNNCGKSNVITYIHKIHTKIEKNEPLKLDQLDSHRPNSCPFLHGKIFQFPVDEHVKEVLDEKSEIDGVKRHWAYYDQDRRPKSFESFKDAHESYYSDRGIRRVMRVDWPDMERRLKDLAVTNIGKITLIKSVLIPAIRKIGQKGSVSDDFSGEGIIERLAKLQNPDALSQKDREKFDYINRFLQNVTENKTAEIEIPHDRETILVHMDERTLPLESLGTGIHEVIILASAATILEDTVICMEEPELHLNPVLQRKLVRYLEKATKNQYFITTHSAALMDTPRAEIYHITLENGESKVYRATSDQHKSEVCHDLGYHPSDLLQSNCIIWVEGPSDRIYLNYWINSFSVDLIEGIHYSIMFYGGRLASHLSGNDIYSDTEEDFISLIRLNRKSVIVIDSDRNQKGARINSTKSRLKREFEDNSGYAWISDGREIENYLPKVQVINAIEAVHPKAKPLKTINKHTNSLKITTEKGNQTQASKVKVAKFITESFEPDLSILNLKSEIKKLVEFIEESNPKVTLSDDQKSA